MTIKSIRDRVGNGLAIHVTKTSRTVPVIPITQRLVEFKLCIKDMTEEAFSKLYTLQHDVMESTNTGMSIVFATRLADGAKCVVKVRDRSCSFKRDSDEQDWRDTTEFQLNMPAVDTLCQFYDVIATRKNYYVIMENVAGMDLFELMVRDTLKPADVREIIYQILNGLKALHGIGRIHRDVKLENVMVDMDSSKEPSSPGGRITPSTKSPRSPGAKLIDFDTVQDWEPSSPRTRHVLGTDGYIAPEAYGGQYSPASDIYSLGVIMYKLLTRRSPHRESIFDDKPGENWVGGPAMLRVQARLKKEVIDFTRRPFSDMQDAADLCKSLLAFNPSERPSAEEAMAHKWFKAGLAH